MHWGLIKWVGAGIAVLALLGGVYWKGYSSGKEKVEAEWAIVRAEQAQELAEALAKIRALEHDMQAQANKLQKEKRDAIRDLNRRHAAVLDGLRDRPSRTSTAGVPGDSGVAEGGAVCTGAELLREDAEFLVGEAARADQLRVELQACYSQYDDVVSAVNGR